MILKAVEDILFLLLYEIRYRYGYFGRRILLKINSLRLLRKEDVEIGEHCRIFSTSFGSESYLIKLGDHVHIG